MEYLDFELEIGPGLGREYPVAVIRSPAGEARQTMTFPYDELALQSRLKDLQIALLRSGGKSRRALSPEEQNVQDFGKDLFKALVGGEVLSRYEVSRREAQQQRKGLRLKLRFQAPELAALPWEFLFDHRRGEYLCLSKNTPTIRYLELPQPIPILTVTPPLRILGMIASPTDLPRLDVDRERQRIENAVQDLQKQGFLDLTWLPGQTWRDLQEAMWGGPWHVFHFIGHGGFDPHTDEGLIALADERGQKHLLTATQVAGLLAEHQDLRLVLLNSCEGAKGGKLDIYSSTAAILVRRGLAAVLAMQYEITDRAAIEFSRTFYRALAYGLPIDAAVAAARAAVNIEVNNSLEWGTPVLYMRSPDGVLFELAALPAARPEPAIVETVVEPLPPEPPLPEVKQGRLWIETDAPDAKVSIINPQTEFSQGMKLEPGRYELSVSAAGYETKREWVELGNGEEKHVSIALTKLKAHLWVETDAPDAKVSIINPQTEFSQGMKLEPGRYELSVSAEGHETKREWVELGAGEDRHLRFKLTLRPTPVMEEKATPALEESEPGAAPGQEVLEPGSGAAAAGAESAPESEFPPMPGKSMAPRIGAALLLAVVLFMAGWWLLARGSATKPITQPLPADKPITQPLPAEMKSFTNSIGMTFVPIPAGIFQMGSPAGEAGRDNDERQHKVTISRPFYLQTTEVTQGQWQKVMGSNPAHFNTCGKDCPVETVSWNDVQEFIRKLNQMEKTDTYRLPTEAEWEWAARAGSATAFHFGDDPAKLPEYAWFWDNSGKTPHPVGQKKPNPRGLYDMHGNVWEWCQDWYGPYPDRMVTDPKGPGSGERRVLRGGSWNFDTRNLRSAERFSLSPGYRHNYIGFRVARTF